VGLVGTVALLATVAGGAQAAWAGTSGGTALIQGVGSGGVPNNVNINNGGSATQFQFKLPSGAKCTNGTGQGFQVFGGLLDTTFDLTATSGPNSINWSSSGPVSGTAGDTRVAFPLVDTTGAPFTNQSTADASGTIGVPPDTGTNAGFNLVIFSIDGRNGTAPVPAGTYNLVVACANVGANPSGANTDVFFAAQVTFSANAGDPNGETWVTVPNPQVPELGLIVGLPLSAAVVIGASVVIVRRRRRHADAVTVAA
jgi:hypothetical protein